MPDSHLRRIRKSLRIHRESAVWTEAMQPRIRKYQKVLILAYAYTSISFVFLFISKKNVLL